MPDKFKALASIAVWVLFIMGLIMFVFAFIFAASKPFDPSELEAWCAVDTALILGTVMLILAVCDMVLRRKLE